MSSQSEKFVCFRLEYITVWSRFLPPGNINLSWRKCKRKRACFAKVRNFGEALTNVAIHALLRELFLLASAVPAQFRIRSISLSAVAKWKEADKLLFTCKHDTEFACSFRTVCCFVKFIFISPSLIAALLFYVLLSLSLFRANLRTANLLGLCFSQRWLHFRFPTPSGSHPA